MRAGYSGCYISKIGVYCFQIYFEDEMFLTVLETVLGGGLTLRALNCGLLDLEISLVWTSFCGVMLSIMTLSHMYRLVLMTCSFACMRLFQQLKRNHRVSFGKL